MVEPPSPPGSADWLVRDLFSQAAENAESEAHPYLRVLAVEVYVRDQDGSLEFYRDRLGFTILADTGQESWGRWIAVAPPSYGSAVLALVKPPKEWAGGMVGRHTGITLMTEDITSQFQKWSAQGVRFTQPPTPVPWGIHATFEDLDANQFNLVQNPEMVEILNAARRVTEERKESLRRVMLEAAIARQVQARLFPQELPAMKLLEYAGTCIPARHVGGDYYDFLELRPDRLALVLADVAGKGVSGALLMANLQAILRSQYAMAIEDLPRLLASVNRVFYKNTGDATYATVFFADYDDSSRRLRYANCGHLPAILLRGGGGLQKQAGDAPLVEWLHPTCTVVGLFEVWRPAIAEVELAPGDTLVLYTDGITEAANGDGEEFGSTRLLDTLSSHSHLLADSLLKAAIGAVQEYSSGEQQDDLTLVIARALD